MSDLSGGGLGTTLRILIWGFFFSVAMYLYLYMYMELTEWARIWNQFYVRELRITGEMWP